MLSRVFRIQFLVAHKDAKQLGEIARHVLPCNLRRHFERISEFPSGLLPIGDAICRFNPIFGQRISVAAQEAVMPPTARGQAEDQLDGLVLRNFAAIQEAGGAFPELSRGSNFPLGDQIHRSRRFVQRYGVAHFDPSFIHVIPG